MCAALADRLNPSARESVTPTADFLICPHPASNNLYVATAGSFHGFKFLPILGKYVVKMLDGSLSPGLKERWSWSSEPRDPNHDTWPEREMRDLFPPPEAGTER